MSRILVFILLFLYLFATSGIPINMHYCMGKMAEWSLWDTHEKTICGTCGMEQSKLPDGCCSDKAEWVKIDIDQKSAVNIYDLVAPVALQPSHQAAINDQLFPAAISNLFPQSHAPPGLSAAPLYKRNCVFLI